MRKFLFPLVLLSLTAPALADSPPAQLSQQQVEAVLAAAPQGSRFGLLVVDDQGRVVAAINPDQRFIPASNTKLFTTAAAYALLPGMDQPDARAGTAVILQSGKGRHPDVVLLGRGDARMSSAPDCKVNCLSELADAVAGKAGKVHDVVGDDSFWPDQRWVPGMSWNNIGTDSGTAVSALNLDDNELRVTVTPGVEGQPPKFEASGHYGLVNEARTIASGGKITLALERPVNGTNLRLYGEIPADSKPWSDRIGLDDPARYAAWTFRRMLEARGVKVTGAVRVAHRPVQSYDRALQPQQSIVPPPIGAVPLASLTPPPLSEDVAIINKDSQNVHAQVLFRRLGDLDGTGSEQWGAKAMNDLFEKAGILRNGYDFSDGSGMSTYNRISPRAAVGLLRWSQTQPWAAAYRASMPIGGIDGTLRRRFAGTPLEGRIWAKTGTLNATFALSGWLRAASGRELTFSIIANDVPDGASAVPAMDTALLVIAAQN